MWNSMKLLSGRKKRKGKGTIKTKNDHHKGP
jgi:hypothetical protein